MKSAFFRTALAAILVTAVGEGLLHAAPSCGNQTVKGIYGEIGWGDVVASLNPALDGPFARVGQTIADGNGTIISHTAASFNGQIFQVPAYSGQYVVSPDCSIVFHMMIPVPFPGAPGNQVTLPIDLAGNISDEGRNVDNMIVSIAGGQPGVAVRILFRKQEKDRCSNQDLNGAYGLDMWGTNVTQAPSGPISRNGAFLFDGKGGFTANTNVSYAGGVVSEALSGAYAVDSQCNLTLLYTLNNIPYKWIGGLADNSSTSTVMVVEPPGAVVIGELKRK